MSAPRLEELMAQETPKLLNCVHCGLCLDECPTYRTSGDEANSPRGRLALWRAEWEGRLEPGPETDAYTDLCVGCLGCVTACPAKVPYGELLMERRAEQARRGKGPDWRVRALSPLLRSLPRLNALAAPLRLARRLGFKIHRLLPPGPAPVFESTASYAAKVNAALKPAGPEVALLSGCLMDAAFREVNAATVRVLALNGYKVLVPEGQACCGAVAEHGGLSAEKALLDERNRRAFADAEVVLSNSSGCGLSLRHAVGDRQRDVVDFLNTSLLKAGAPLDWEGVLYDFPCHAYHGLGLRRPPEALFAAAGLAGRWKLAPEAERCCGGGGAYALSEAESSLGILAEKKALLGDLAPGATLVTGNHVCMMQWSQIKGLRVLHAVQVLDESYRKAGFY
ncbi:MAG TPA: (Fe-S)-binding protein [bacterium]|jgi:glycolate oxidase iron-sulfur subunit|nr:(Fe-S)-binding protein [bacterium]